MLFWVYMKTVHFSSVPCIQNVMSEYMIFLLMQKNTNIMT